jgi:aminoglycoside phosphotransferase (APT) family kinase protein
MRRSLRSLSTSPCVSARPLSPAYVSAMIKSTPQYGMHAGPGGTTAAALPGHGLTEPAGHASPGLGGMFSGMAVDNVPGIDGPRLARWLSANGIANGEPTGIELIAGGRSNLTYRVDLGSTRLVLRRPPLGHVLPTAHDMSREFRVLTALHGTDIPVPAPVAICADADVIGAPFYLMDYVDGVVLRTREDGERLTPAQARQLSERLVEMLAAIHAVDVAATGLTGFGRPEGYLARQLARWQRQWELSNTREMPGYDRLVERLAAGLPDDGDHTLVHGDFRLDNTLVTLGGTDGQDGRPDVAAVVDWEMSTLGDPLADLGLTLIYWADPDDAQWGQISIGATVTAMPGFLTRAEIADRYAELTGRDLSGLGYYMAFGCFKLAVVLEGIHARFLQNQTVGEGFEREGFAVPVLIERAHQMLDRGLPGAAG